MREGESCFVGRGLGQRGSLCYTAMWLIYRPIMDVTTPPLLLLLPRSPGWLGKGMDGVRRGEEMERGGGGVDEARGRG